ncbi:MAG: DUF5106 domain-containing protein [Muribaculaceae bacterium]|nr:DUF5106 domain-containing protein [Muribaculaceae bacterium]
MKRFSLLIAGLLIALGALAQGATLFAYPVAPESLPFGRPRANYIVEHFWDDMPWKTAHTMPMKMENTLRGFADFLTIASADTVHRSVNKLIAGARKKAECFDALMTMAEATFYSDTAHLYSDEVYLPFVEAASTFKKLPAERRERYARQARVIKASSEGMTLPAITARRSDGSEFALNDTVSGAMTYVIIIEQPGSSRFERVRFAANHAVNSLAEAGLIKLMLIYAGEAPEQWWLTTAGLSGSWSVGELPDAAEWFDLRQSPGVYLLDGKMTVTAKMMPVDVLIANCENLVNSINRSIVE